MKRYLNILNILNYKKFTIFLPLFFIFLPNHLFAEQLLTISETLKKSNECFENLQYKVCNKLFLEMEKFQLVESEQNRYKCQASILGLQTELIEAYYSQNLRKNHNSIMIPYVIKNC